jgi:AAA domain
MANGRHRISRPRLIELTGPAGVGKSTLAISLLQRLEAAPGTIWGQPALSLVGNGLGLLPTITGFCLEARSALWDEARHIVRLRTLHRALAESERRVDVLIFDEGPIFALAWLRGFGHETFRSDSSAGWWHTVLLEWAAVMDAVVVLDAPDSVLAQRIRTRPVSHEVKGFPDPEVSLWMARFRTALDWVLAEMTRLGGPVVLRLSTAEEPSERLVEQLLEGLNGSVSGH